MPNDDDDDDDDDVDGYKTKDREKLSIARVTS